jgi:hypothetical protein
VCAVACGCERIVRSNASAAGKARERRPSADRKSGLGRGVPGPGDPVGKGPARAGTFPSFPGSLPEVERMPPREDQVPETPSRAIVFGVSPRTVTFPPPIFPIGNPAVGPRKMHALEIRLRKSAREREPTMLAGALIHTH